MATAQELSRLTDEFYARTSDSFSKTREHPWSGWQRVLAETSLLAQREKDQNGREGARGGSLRVADIACGNLRFERFLAELLDGTTLDDTALGEDALVSREVVAVDAYDNCDQLAKRVLATWTSPRISVAYSHLDIVRILYQQDGLKEMLGEKRFDVTVCFGFMHHVPLVEHRERLLSALVSSVVPNGLVAISFWQLSNSERLLTKARATTQRATEQFDLKGLDTGDYLLGWQDCTDVYRYCHDFTEGEIDLLVQSVATQCDEIARFSSDGATGNLNRYVILRRHVEKP